MTKVTKEMVKEASDAVIDKMFPGFDKWLRGKGYAIVSMTPEELKSWYEYLDLVMGGR